MNKIKLSFALLIVTAVIWHLATASSDAPASSEPEMSQNEPATNVVYRFEGLRVSATINGQ